jgi:omega-amidase
MLDLKLTLLQADLVWQDPAANRALLETQIAASAATADLIVLPETFSTGFTMNATAVAEPMDGPTVTWLQRMAAEHSVDLCGSIIVSAAGQHFNRLLWASASGELHTYDKRHLFMGGEREAYTPGHERLVVTLGDWRICPLVCYDLRFPVWSRYQGDYDLLLYVANWPAPRHSAWATLLPARAVENLCYVAGVNRVGTDGNGIVTGGGSVIADYLGTALATADDQPTTLSATLSLDKLTRYRKKFPAWKDADSFSLDVDTPTS